MKKIIAFLLILVFILSVAGCTDKNKDDGGEPTGFIIKESTAEPGTWEYYNDLAENFVKLLANRDFETAFEMFNEELKPLLPAETLQENWRMIGFYAGNFIDIHDIENQKLEDYYICFVTSKHENSGVRLQVVFTEDGSIGGFFVDDYPVIPKDG